MDQLEKIELRLPTTNEEERAFVDSLSLLFQSFPTSLRDEEDLRFCASIPGCSPVVEINAAQIGVPAIVFHTNKNLGFELDGLVVCSLSNVQSTSLKAQPNKESDSNLEMGELASRFFDHIVRVDHFGFNVPAGKMEGREFDKFISKLASISALYDYPTGEPWYFILPATQDEFVNGIVEFPFGREPKFEIVYDEYSLVPVLQIDVETDLSRSEVKRLLPAPSGFALLGLEQYFRAATVKSPWQNLSICFDFRYVTEDLKNDWNTGHWLATEGRRHQ